MKKFVLGLCAIALAVSFSAFTTFAPLLQVESDVVISTSNVGSADSYTSLAVSCPETSGNPCQLDLGRIDEAFDIDNEAEFITYINNASLFPTAADKVTEVLRLTVDWKE